MDQSQPRLNKTATYLASAAVLGTALFLITNPWIGIPLLIGGAIGGYYGAKKAPENFGLLKKDVRHLAGSLISHGKEDGGRFKKWLGSRKVVQNAKKKMKSVAASASEKSSSTVFGPNGSTKPAFTENATPAASAPAAAPETVVPGATAKNLDGNTPA